VQIYVNSPGGVVTSGLAIYDTMEYVRCPVSTMCVGQAASMGAVLLAAGQKKRRFALPNARVMIHQPLGGARGEGTEIAIQAREIKKMKNLIIEILTSATGKGRDKISKDSKRNYYLTEYEAKK